MHPPNQLFHYQKRSWHRSSVWTTIISRFSSRRCLSSSNASSFFFLKGPSSFSSVITSLLPSFHQNNLFFRIYTWPFPHVISRVFLSVVTFITNILLLSLITRRRYILEHILSLFSWSISFFIMPYEPRYYFSSLSVRFFVITLSIIFCPYINISFFLHCISFHTIRQWFVHHFRPSPFFHINIFIHPHIFTNSFIITPLTTIINSFSFRLLP